MTSFFCLSMPHNGRSEHELIRVLSRKFASNIVYSDRSLGSPGFHQWQSKNDGAELLHYFRFLSWERCSPDTFSRRTRLSIRPSSGPLNYIRTAICKVRFEATRRY